MSGIPVKNMNRSKFTGCKTIHPLRSHQIVLGAINSSEYLVNLSTFCSNDWYECFWGRSLPALHSEMVKSLPILHVKIALVLPSLMEIVVDGLQSSNLAINVKMGSSCGFDWATQ